MIKHALEQIGIEFSSENDREIQFKCVFHDDNTPSASINKKTGRWICFTCEVGGNILHLSNKQNVQLDNLNEIRAILRKNKLKSLLRKEPEQLNYYFFPKVFKKITNITDCPEYLLNRLSINTVLNFNLHYCDDKNSKYFERIIIPITLENNLGFTAREYTKNTNYKYLFPEGMQKSKFIFGDLGFNFEPSEIGASFGLVQLEKFSKFEKLRNINFNYHLNFFKRYGWNLTYHQKTNNS